MAAAIQGFTSFLELLCNMVLIIPFIRDNVIIIIYALPSAYFYHLCAFGWLCECGASKLSLTHYFPPMGFAHQTWLDVAFIDLGECY